MPPQNLEIEPGAVVLARDGFIGTVEEVFSNQPAGQPGYFVTSPNSHGDRLLIPLDLIDPVSQPAEVYLKEVFENVLARSRTIPVGTNILAALAETATPTTGPETLVKDTQGEAGSGTAAPSIPIRKTIKQVEETRRLPLSYEELAIERVAVNRPIDAPLEPYYEGEVLVIPVMEEVLVVEKRLMLKEEVRITKRRTVREQQVTEILQRESLEVGPPPNSPANPGGSTDERVRPGAPSPDTPPGDALAEILDGDMDPPGLPGQE
jgi:uncharacterized protein (TIGR02271 family)